MLTTFQIYAKNPEKGKELRNCMENNGFRHGESPDFIVSLGGDGTFLRCEKKFPGIPKLLVRDSMVCFKCHNEPVSDALEKIKKGEMLVSDIIKLNAFYKEKNFTAVNDVMVRNKDIRQGVRFKISINGEESDLFIGDGVVISTPFGSTGYYHAITKSKFDKGIGIAFNNITKPVDNKVLDEDSEIKIEIKRGEAELAFDNQEEKFTMKSRDFVIVKKSNEIGRLMFHK